MFRKRCGVQKKGKEILLFFSRAQKFLTKGEFELLSAGQIFAAARQICSCSFFIHVHRVYFWELQFSDPLPRFCQAILCFEQRFQSLGLGTPMLIFDSDKTSRHGKENVHMGKNFRLQFAGLTKKKLLCPVFGNTDFSAKSGHMILRNSLLSAICVK